MHLLYGKPDPDDDPSYSIELFFPAVQADGTLGFVDFVNWALDKINMATNTFLVGYFSVRFSGATRAFLGMQQWNQTCSIEISVVRGTATELQLAQGELQLLTELLGGAYQRGGLAHWGQLLDVGVQPTARLYPRLPEWREAYARLSNNFAARTFENALSRRWELTSPVVTGQVWHTIRNPDGTWQPAFGHVEDHEQSDPGVFTAIGCAGVVSQLQVVGIVGGQLWHTIRNADGSWQPVFGRIEDGEQNNPGAFTAISCAGVGNQLQLVGIVDGQLWHTLRNADGTWAPTFGRIEGQEQNNPGAFTGISCAGVGNQLQVVGIVGGQLWHTIRNADGTWAPTFGRIEGQEHNNPGAFTGISCAGVGNQLQVVGIVGGQLWHTIRNADGSWQPVFGRIEDEEWYSPGDFTAISCGGVLAEMQLAGIV